MITVNVIEDKWTTGYSAKTLEEAVDKLLEIKDKDPNANAYIESEGKRIDISEVSREQSMEENLGKLRPITFEEYSTEFDVELEKSERGDTDYSIFDLADDIERIPDNSMRVDLLIRYLDRLKGVPAVIDNVSRQASDKDKEKLLVALRENGMRPNPYIFKVDSVEMRIAMDCFTQHPEWGLQEPKNLEDAQGITGGSEVAAIEGLVKVLGFDDFEKEALLEHIYFGSRIEFTEEDIKRAISQKGVNETVLDVLSNVHDGWTRTNGPKFDKPGRETQFQFVPFEMLSWEEAEKDLIFLKPILEDLGIEIDLEALKNQFKERQEKFLEEKGITSHEALVSKLKEGAAFYPALEGVVGTQRISIDELLKTTDIAEKMANQIEDRVEIKEKTVSTREIAEASKELTTTKTKGIKAFFMNLLDKIKGIKGKGEK